MMIKIEKTTKKVERQKMITTILTLVVGMFLSTGCSSVFSIRGNGNLVTSEKTVPAFEKINIGGYAEVRYYASEQYRVVVTVDENINEYIEIFTQNNVLNIRPQRDNNYKFTKFLVEVYSPVLTGVSISGSGNFTGVDKIIAPTFESIVSGSGKVEGVIECESFSARISGSGRIEGTVESVNFSGNISGSGRITVSGASKNANVTISGSGNFNGGNFFAKIATVNISGSGRANICVEETLNARVSGSGSVNYCGEPAQINSNVSGSGRVRKM